jgi:protein involved in polysaccharide export with SLBB domain
MSFIGFVIRAQKKSFCAFAAVSLICGLSLAQTVAPVSSGCVAGVSARLPNGTNAGPCDPPGATAQSTTLSPAALAAARATGLTNAADTATNPVGQNPDKANFNAPGPQLNPLGTNQFQSFVQETSGRTLPLYGYNLFGANSFPSLTNVPVPSNYVLGPGDEINVQIWGATDGNLKLLVDRNGQINIPKVGPLTVAGTRADQLEALLKTHIGRVFNNFQLSATLGRLRSIQIFVVGQARNPGVYTVSSLSTLISALFESGGPSATGSMRKIQLMRAGKAVSTIDLYKFIHSGDTSADARLLPGDVIVIPPTGARVALLGALDNPAIYEISGQEETLAQLLAYSGGLQILTTPHKVLVERINTGPGKAPRSVEERALTTEGLNSTVRDGDVVTLFKISPEFANAVTLRGNVAAPLRYTYRPGMKVSDLIPEVSALIQSDYYSRKNILVEYESGKVVSTERVGNEVKNQLEEINWDFASIERLDPKEVRTTLLHFNLGKAVRDHDPANDLALLPGDVVTIFSVNNLPVPVEKRSQFVRIGGEVMAPGIYQIQADETLPHLIRRIGGLSQNAFAYGTVFTRESTRLQQQENLNKSMRRVESDINSQTSASLQNVGSAETATTLQAQVAIQKNLLSRLQTLKASGRIALELDPNDPVLPAIRLEDGDQITVPNRPSFVGVFGEVLTESSFIHKPGYTVKDYIDKAGLTRDADTDNLMVIRADGTVEGGARQSSFWSSGVMGKNLYPGDTVFVPGLIDRRTGYTQFIQGAKDWTAILSQFGLGVAAFKVLGY